MTIRVCMVRDHSASMGVLVNAAKKDYNSQVQSFKGTGARISVVECGVHLGYNKAAVRVDFTDIDADFVNPISIYRTDGLGTPLWDSVGRAIQTFRSDFPDPKLVMVITDGFENHSSVWRVDTLMKEIQKLQATDLWTFVFRVPVGHKANLVRLGIPEGNVMEWDQNEASFARSTEQTVHATQAYVQAVAKGQTSTRNFYNTNLANVKPSEIKAVLDDITSLVRVESVWSEDNGIQIRDFCQKHFGEFEIGRVYYELTKAEKVQQKKKLVIKHKKKGRYYGGADARNLLGLPSYGEIKVVPGDHGEYEIYVQSTSVNRKVLTKTKVLYI